VEWTPGRRSVCTCCGVGPAPLTASVGQHRTSHELFAAAEDTRRVGFDLLPLSSGCRIYSAVGSDLGEDSAAWSATAARRGDALAIPDTSWVCVGLLRRHSIFPTTAASWCGGSSRGYSFGDHWFAAHLVARSDLRLKKPNQSIEPTGGSRFCQSTFVSPWRLPPVAHAQRWVAA
jgi:hypothetical protein